MQTERLFEMIYLLMEKRSLTAKELAEHFEISTRTVMRDFEALSMAGIPVYAQKGRGGGICLMEDFVLDKGLMTDDEKKLLLSGLQAVGAVHAGENEEILGKLESMLGKTDDNWIEVDFGKWNNADREKSKFETIKYAILHKRQIAFNYANAKGESSSRTVEPMKLVFRSMSWYVYAYCTNKEDYRFFKLSRIQNLSMKEKTFPRRVEGVKKEQNFYRENVEKRKITLLFDKSVAYRVYDEFPEYRTYPNGDVLVEGEMEYGVFLYEYILSFGDKVKIIEPDDFKENYKQLIKNIIALYL